MIFQGPPKITWVFCAMGRELLTKNNFWSRLYMTILKRAKQMFTEQDEKKEVIPKLLPIIRFHNLRNTDATIMLSQESGAFQDRARSTWAQ